MKIKGWSARVLGFGLLPLFAALTGCGGAQQAPTAQVPVEATAAFKPVVSINQIMVSVIDHNSHFLWDVALEKNAPKTDADWHALEHAAVTLAASGNMILAGGTGKSDDMWSKGQDWRRHTQEMTDAAAQALRDAQGKDLKALVATGDKIVAACEACHTQYKTELPKIRATPAEQPQHLK